MSDSIVRNSQQSESGETAMISEPFSFTVYRQIKPDTPVTVEIQHKNRKTRKMRKDEPKGWVYLIKGGDYYKIGSTCSSIYARLKALQGPSPLPLELMWAIWTDRPRSVEEFLHDVFAEERLHSEWFAITDDDAEWIMEEYGVE